MAAGNRRRRAKPQIQRGGDREKPKTCPVTGKKSWKSAAAALRAAAGSATKLGHPMRPYVCPHCGRWHLTSKPKR